MALLETAIETASEAISDVSEIALGTLEGVSATVSQLSEDRRSRKGLIFLLLLAAAAIIGFVVWKRASSREDSGSADLYTSPSSSSSSASA
jgi:hypothetical protein